MAIINLSALADRARYLENQGMSTQEAEEKAFNEFNLNPSQLDENMRSQYERYRNNEQAQTELNGELEGDKDRIINRSEAGTYETYDTNPQAPTEEPQE